MSYDSRPDTLAHIKRVYELVRIMRDQLLVRASLHDSTKLEEPELSLFNEWTPKLKELTYGSDEYAQHWRHSSQRWSITMRPTRTIRSISRTASMACRCST
jgi:hypothetical protein